MVVPKTPSYEDVLAYDIVYCLKRVGSNVKLQMRNLKNGSIYFIHLEQNVLETKPSLVTQVKHL